MTMKLTRFQISPLVGKQTVVQLVFKNMVFEVKSNLKLIKSKLFETNSVF